MKLIPTILVAFATLASAANLTTVFQYPPGTWLENIAHMRNGSLLVTLIGSPEVRIVNPTVSPATSALVKSFPHANSVLGITEVKKDVFAVAVGTLNTTNNTPQLGSFSIWTVDLACNKDSVEVSKVLDVPSMGMPNGVTTLTPNLLLVADSWNGDIVAVTLSPPSSSVILRDQTLEADLSGKASLPFGVNGLKFHSRTSTLYFSNTVQNLLGRVKVNAKTGAAIGLFETIAQGEHVSQPDDFAVMADGSVLLARPVADTIQHIKSNGRVREVARGGLASGATSVVSGSKKGEVFLSESGLVGGVSGGGGRVVKVTL